MVLLLCRQGMLFKHHPHKASERELELSHKRERSQNSMTPRSLKWLIVTSGHDKCSGWRLLCLRGISTIGRRGRHGFDWESAGIPVWGFTRAASPPREEECEAAWCTRIVLLANGSLLGEKRLRKSCVFRAFQCNVTNDAQL